MVFVRQYVKVERKDLGGEWVSCLGWKGRGETDGRTEGEAEEIKKYSSEPCMQRFTNYAVFI